MTEVKTAREKMQDQKSRSDTRTGQRRHTPRLVPRCSTACALPHWNSSCLDFLKTRTPRRARPDQLVVRFPKSSPLERVGHVLGFASALLRAGQHGPRMPLLFPLIESSTVWKFLTMLRFDPSSKTSRCALIALSRPACSPGNMCT